MSPDTVLARIVQYTDADRCKIIGCLCDLVGLQLHTNRQNADVTVHPIKFTTIMITHCCWRKQPLM